MHRRVAIDIRLKECGKCLNGGCDRAGICLKAIHSVREPRLFEIRSKTNLDPSIQNPCDAPMLRKICRPGKPIHWEVVEKETIDEIIFRTTKLRNRLMLELMAREA